MMHAEATPPAPVPAHAPGTHSATPDSVGSEKEGRPPPRTNSGVRAADAAATHKRTVRVLTSSFMVVVVVVVVSCFGLDTKVACLMPKMAKSM